MKLIPAKSAEYLSNLITLNLFGINYNNNKNKKLLLSLIPIFPFLIFSTFFIREANPLLKYNIEVALHTVSNLVCLILSRNILLPV